MFEDDWAGFRESNERHIGRSGIVAGCTKLNVREEPQPDAEVVCAIDCTTEVMVYEQESTDAFYKICLASGIEGFCMKKFINLQ